MKILSISSRLLRWLAIPIILVIVVTSFIIFTLLNKNINQQYDNALLVATKSIEEKLYVNNGILKFNMPYFGLDIQTSSGDGSIFYSIEDTNNKILAGFENIPKPKKIVQGKSTFYFTKYAGEKIRAIFFKNEIYRSGKKYRYKIIVAETLEDRKTAVLSIFLITISLTLIIGIIAIIASLFAVKKGIKPLTNLQYSIKKRDIHDLTPIKEDVPYEVVSLVKSINRLFTRLKKSFLHVEQFNSDVSHQLRTPLAELKAMIETDENLINSQDRQRYISVIDNMTHTTEQLLLYAKTNPDAFDRDWFTKINISHICKNFSLSKVPFIYKKGFEFNFDVDENLWIIGGELTLESMLNNLVDNSLKYAVHDPNRQPLGIITLSLKEKKENIILSITDNGDGIPEKYIKNICERFFRIDRRKQGSGLGLGIVRQIAKLHNANLKISNIKPHGLCVDIVFKKL
jgi:two-component system sensor histidine kinase TctE